MKWSQGNDYVGADEIAITLTPLTTREKYRDCISTVGGMDPKAGRANPKKATSPGCSIENTCRRRVMREIEGDDKLTCFTSINDWRHRQ